MSEVRLSQLVPAGGWARKLGARDLVQVLSEIAPFDHPWVDAQAAPMEDAAVVRPENGAPFVLTVDFITPIVDEPEAFGAIAAANSISDVYAMGGEPQVALAVCGYPEDRVGLEILQRIFRGGRDKAAEAGCAIVGGHTVIDPELKYGLCVVGSVDPDHVLDQSSARDGDVLILTKPIGTGIGAQAIKSDRLGERDLATLVGSMTALNRGAKDAALAGGVRAATDVTGFGLLGHLHNMLLGSGVAARVQSADVPVFDFVRPLVDDGVVPGGTKRNLDYVAPHVEWSSRLGESDQLVLCDAQTSGGLLLAVPRAAQSSVLRELKKQATLAAAVIGEIVSGPTGAISVS